MAVMIWHSYGTTEFTIPLQHPTSATHNLHQHHNAAREGGNYKHNTTITQQKQQHNNNRRTQHKQTQPQQHNNQKQHETTTQKEDIAHRSMQGGTRVAPAPQQCFGLQNRIDRPRVRQSRECG